jgi:hypothetical protein
MQKICALARCGARFEGRGTRKFCSHQHYAAAKRREPDVVACEGCHGPFRRRYPSHRFCSTGCASASRLLPPKPCEGCGRPFRPDLRLRRFCSFACSAKAHRLTLPLDEIRADYAQGMRVLDIELKYGFSEWAIYAHMDRDGVRWTRP